MRGGHGQDRVGRRRAAAQAAGVDPLLDGDVRPGLELQGARADVRAVVVVQRSLDVDRVRDVAFDEVAVVAVHGPDEVCERREHAVRQPVTEPGRPGRQLHGEVGELAAVSRTLANEQRLHEGLGLAPIGTARVRLDVRCHVRS